MQIDPIIVEHEITRLMTFYPELAEDDVLRADMIEGSTSVHEFLSKIVRLIGENKSRSDGISNYINELCERKERFGRRVEALRAIAHKIMTMAGLKKIELDEATLSIRKGGRKLVIPDDSAVPDEYCRIKKEPDKIVIKDGLTSGAIAPNWATLVQSDDTLSIRTK